VAANDARPAARGNGADGQALQTLLEDAKAREVELARSLAAAQADAEDDKQKVAVSYHFLPQVHEWR
jgi:hypothetical protein